MKKKVLLIFGGRSAEHEISILSARNVASALDRNLYDLQLVGISKEGTWYSFPSENIFEKIKALSDQALPSEAEPCCLVSQKGHPHLIALKTSIGQKVDIAFPVLHGTFGEDGCIQGLFKMMNIAFVGCGIFGSSAGMDKEVMKRIFKEAGIPTARYKLLTPNSFGSYHDVSKELGSVFFIKPANMGSSVGVHKIKSEADYKAGLKDAFLYDHKVLAEEFIEGREIECAVLGHNQSPRASVCGEVTPTHEFYSYEAKYLDEKGAALKIPADLSADILKKIQEIARKTFQVMGCEGLTRVDFFLKKNGEAIVNEINTIPGFTKISMYPKMWEASGIGYTALISELLKLGFEAFEQEQSLQTQFPGAR
jgi:D-alanine-D-alanine ligase